VRRYREAAGAVKIDNIRFGRRDAIDDETIAAEKLAA